MSSNLLLDQEKQGGEDISPSVSATSDYSRLRASMENDFPDEPVVVLEPGADYRDYTLEEVEKVRRRPFASRLYMSGTSIDSNAVWLRSRFTECHEMESPTRRIHDLAKSAILSKGDNVAAYSALADLLTLMFRMEDAEYYSLATTLASALSSYGEGIIFQSNTDENYGTFMVEGRSKEGRAQKLFTELMSIVFAKVSIEDHIVTNNMANIYRVAYCMVKYKDAETTPNYRMLQFKVYLETLATLVSQIMLTVYILIQIGSIAENDAHDFLEPTMLPLGLVTLVLSFLMSLPEFRAVKATSELYSGGSQGNSSWAHPMAMIDYFANFILPLLLTIAGFAIVATADDFINGVLNATALLFIVELDDMMLDSYDLDVKAIVHDHLVTEASLELKEAIKHFQDCSKSSMQLRLQERFHVSPIHFADMLLTNSAEGGTDIKSNRVYAPHEILGSSHCPIVKASNFITCNCLLKRIEWSYSSDSPFSTKPEIAYLKVWKLWQDNSYEVVTGGVLLDTSRVVNVRPHHVNDEMYPDELRAMRNEATINSDEAQENLRKMNPVYRLEGVYMLTVFECSELITDLRICGSRTATDFATAVDAYSLWDLHSSAERVLYQRQDSKETQEKPYQDL